MIRIMDGKIVSDTRLNEEEKNIDQIAAQIEKEGNEE